MWKVKTFYTIFMNKENILIRQAIKSDLKNIKPLVKFFLKVEKTGNIIKETDLLIKKRIKPALSSSNAKVFVAEVNKKIIAFLSVEFRHGLVAYLAYLAVDPKYQKFGIGSQLVKHASNYSKKIGIKILQTLAHKDNKGSKKFHEKLGFKFFGYTLRKKI